MDKPPDRRPRPLRFVRRAAVFACLCVLAFSSSLACRDASKRAQDHLARGNGLLERGDARAAIVELRSAVKADPKLGPAHEALGQAYLRAGDPASALQSSVRAADLMPQKVETQLQAGGLLLLAGRHEDARSRAEKVLELDARSVPALVLRAKALAGLADLDGAIAAGRAGRAHRPQQRLELCQPRRVSTAEGQARRGAGDLRPGAGAGPGVCRRPDWPSRSSSCGRAMSQPPRSSSSRPCASPPTTCWHGGRSPCSTSRPGGRHSPSRT